MNLQKHLSDNKFICPIPIQNKNNNIVNTLCNKKAIIISFLEGKSIEKANAAMCKEVGKMIANLHNLTMKFEEKRPNNLDLKAEFRKIPLYKIIDQTIGGGVIKIEPLQDHLM